MKKADVSKLLLRIQVCTQTYSWPPKVCAAWSAALRCRCIRRQTPSPCNALT